MKEVKKVDHLSDILKYPIIRPCWMKGVPLIDRFKYSFGSDSVEHQIWQRAMKMGINDSLIAFNADAFNNFLERANKEELAFISYDFVVDAARRYPQALLNLINIGISIMLMSVCIPCKPQAKNGAQHEQ